MITGGMGCNNMQPDYTGDTYFLYLCLQMTLTFTGPPSSEDEFIKFSRRNTHKTRKDGAKAPAAYFALQKRGLVYNSRKRSLNNFPEFFIPFNKVFYSFFQPDLRCISQHSRSLADISAGIGYITLLFR